MPLKAKGEKKMEKAKLNVKIELEGNILKKFNVVKQNYGMLRNTSILLALINEKYEQLEREKRMKRLSIDQETFDRLEVEGRKQGLSADEYATKLLEEVIKKVE
jgi:hypothetical protein